MPEIIQPIHPSIRDSLDPDYVRLHDDILQYCPRTESLEFHPVHSRNAVSPMAHASQKIVAVGRVEDRVIYTDPADGSTITVRIFTPEGAAPAAGWPLLAWYHGGGWVNGGLNSENGFLTHLCKYIRCVVITINYRHAPEHVYPAAFNDSFAGYKWAVSPTTVAELNLDTSKVAVGGLSAGGGLTASLSMKIAEEAASSSDKLPTPAIQLLVCPVIDNTVNTDTDPAVRAGWSMMPHSPFLTPTRMQWYRDHYFGTDPATVAKSTAEWEASPCFASVERLATSPPTFLSVSGCDLLGPEASAYGDQLAKAGVKVDKQLYAGGTHSILVLAGIHALSRKLVHDASGALARAWGLEYNPATAPILSQEE